MYIEISIYLERGRLMCNRVVGVSSSERATASDKVRVLLVGKE